MTESRTLDLFTRLCETAEKVTHQPLGEEIENDLYAIARRIIETEEPTEEGLPGPGPVG